MNGSQCNILMHCKVSLYGPACVSMCVCLVKRKYVPACKCASICVHVSDFAQRNKTEAI